MDESFDIVIIGSGLGGLAAGVLATRAGARVLVVERNSFCGGAATTYRRGGLVVEAALHETSHPEMPGDPKGALFEVLQRERRIEMVRVPALQEVRWKGLGEPFVLPDGFPEAEAALAKRFPEHARPIHDLLEEMRRTVHLMRMAGGAQDNAGALSRAAGIPLDLWSALRDMRASLGEVFRRHFGDNEALKFALCSNLPYYSDDPDTFWWMGFAVAQGFYLQGGAWYIRGGSQVLTDAMVSYIRDHGGEVRTEFPAVGMEFGEKGIVNAVTCLAPDGRERRIATHVVLANAAPQVVAGLMPKAKGEEFLMPFEGRVPSISLFSATLGLSRSPRELGVTSYSTMLIPDWMEEFADFAQGTSLFGADPWEAMPALCIVDHNQIDCGLEGRLSDRGEKLWPLSIVAPDRLKSWQALDQRTYDRRREDWIQAIISRLDTEWPGLAVSVRQKEVMTARSMQSHLNTPEGAVYGFDPKAPKSWQRARPRQVKTAVPGLFLASAWGGFGGYTGAIGNGTTAARQALRHLEARGHGRRAG